MPLPDLTELENYNMTVLFMVVYKHTHQLPNVCTKKFCKFYGSLLMNEFCLTTEIIMASKNS